ncbi:hypothetical protein SUGI_0570270 [Cryptomeria japonica]|uniref:putative UPF0481 protein At3g02645 n=1 Tax=Cryptomeria japonica TaxID=3369 RepID=UPI002408DE79|nr:putative UPF0481 protein At3g02645 [Cryptomeria japonica]GLJ28912.1 hypothetical protein SUGI_0570270 [Cryptomeria japonica]
MLDIYHYFCLGVVASENDNEAKLNVCCSSLTDLDGGQCLSFGCPLQHSENIQNPSRSKEWRQKVPSAVQLKNAGVVLKADSKKVVDTRFEGKTLTLPSLKLDVDSEIYVGNLVALENSSPYYKSKSMTAYIKLMYELCKTEKRVDVMREEGVLVGNLWQHSDAVRVFSLCKQSHLSASQDLFEKTRRKLIKYCNRKFWTAAAILWNEFCNAYGSKPWLVVGGFGGTLVLCLTAIQVFCLFKHYGPRCA